MPSSEDEFEIECEEIVLSESEDMDPLEVNMDEESENEGTSSIEKQKQDETQKWVPLKGMSLNMLPDATKLKYIRRPTRPVRLFSFTDRDILNRFSKPTEASKSLAMRLLDIVKAVNVRRPVKVENGVVVPNFYLMATQCEPKEGEKVTKLDSMDIVNLIKDIIHMIKIGVYRRVDFVDIICDSPAIFMVKYIHVKNWNPKLNAVYVVTSEYLLPYLCKIRAAEEEEEKAKKRITNSMVERDKRYKKVPAKRKNAEKSVIVEKKTKDQKTEPITHTVKQEPEVETCAKNETTTKPKPKTTNTQKDDVDTVRNILSKYLDVDAVNFFTMQMKLSGKKASRYRWSDDDKIFALNLLRTNPAEYSLLFDEYSLPSDKSLEKFVEKLKQNRSLGQRVRKSTRKR